MLVQLRLKRKHPHNRFRVQEVTIDSYTFKEYEVSDAAAKELKDKGVLEWVEVLDKKEAQKLKAAKEAVEAAKLKAEKERLEFEAAEKEKLDAEAKAKELEDKNKV